MKIVNNEKIISRNKKISRVVLFASLGLLVAAFLWSLNDPDTKKSTLAYLILIPAYLLIQVSIYLSNRWGREPRPDQIISSQLKGLNNKYLLINYYVSIPHLLIGPAGMIIINPFHQSGVITYDQRKNRFHQKGGANFLAKTFGQESIPNIIKNSASLEKDFKTFLDRNGFNTNIPLKVINIFHSEEAEIQTKNAPVTVIHARKLKDFVRREAKTNKFDLSEIDKVSKHILDKVISS